MYGIFAAAAMGARTGAALRHVLIKLGTKAADTATKQGRLVKKIDMSIKKYASKEGKESLQKRYNLPPMSDKVARAIQGVATAGLAGLLAQRTYDIEQKKKRWATRRRHDEAAAARKNPDTGKPKKPKTSQIAAKKKTGHTDHRTGGMFYKSGRK